MFELINVTLKVGNKTILQNTSITINTGFNIVKAPSGEGKTTFLKMLNYLVSPSSGSVKYQGRDISKMDLPLFRSKCIMVPQRIILTEGSVMDNVEQIFRLKNHVGKKLDKSKLNLLLNTLNLKEEILNAEAPILSGGEAQRIAIIRAILLDPECLIIDEPSSALDRKTATSLFKMLKDFFSSKLLIVSSHDEHALEYGDVIFEISNGSIKRID